MIDLTISAQAMGNPTNPDNDEIFPGIDDLVPSALQIEKLEGEDTYRVYVVCSTKSNWNAGNLSLAFLYWTDDCGATWSSFRIGVP